MVSDYYYVDTPGAEVEVRYIYRKYQWKGFWKLDTEWEETRVVRFYKANGKWVQAPVSGGALAKLPQGWVDVDM